MRLVLRLFPPLWLVLGGGEAEEEGMEFQDGSDGFSPVLVSGFFQKQGQVGGSLDSFEF